MTKREVGFPLIGLGIGLTLAVAAIIEFVLWFHHMFLVGIQWGPESILLAVPFALILAGGFLLFRERSLRPPS